MVIKLSVIRLPLTVLTSFQSCQNLQLILLSALPGAFLSRSIRIAILLPSTPKQTHPLGVSACGA